MIQRVNNIIVNWLIREGSIDEDDREVYQYVIQGIMENGITLTVIFIDMIILKSIIVGIVFILSFKFLRKYSGGYHAETYLKCFILSNLSFICAVALIKYGVIDSGVYRASGLAASRILYFLGPVDSPNKPLSKKEKQIYYKNEKITICIVLIICIIMYVMNITEIEKAIESAVILNGFTSLYVVIRRKQNGNICL